MCILMEGSNYMHFTGQIWRPPYEAYSMLLEVTAGCTHHKCKFCTLYNDLPFSFKMSNLEDIKADLKEIKERYKAWNRYEANRSFLTGANPFVLKAERLLAIAEMIHTYFPINKTIGCFARITDITQKTDLELYQLSQAGFDGLTIGMETADDEALKFMNKGYLSEDIIKQCKRLDEAGISYKFFYLTGISGSGRGEYGAKATACICNQLNPKMVGANIMTIYPDSELYQEIKNGNWIEETEIEKYIEVRTLVENLEIPVEFAALGASNAFQLIGNLPEDRHKLLSKLDRIINNVDEEELRNYRRNLRHL